MSSSLIVVHGEVSSKVRASIAEATSTLGASAEYVRTPAQLGRALDSAEPAAVVVALKSEGALEACREVRGRSPMARVPLLGLTDAVDDAAFLQLFRLGGDDLIDDRAISLVRRVGAIAARPARPEETDAVRQLAVVAGANPTWRSIVARSLGAAGLDVAYAGTLEEALERSRHARFVIAADDLPPHGAAKAISQRESDVPWVVVAPPDRIASARAVIDGMGHVAVVDANGPPEDALFVANGLVHAHAAEARSDARILYGTAVRFRVAGRDQDDMGFTYNVSAGGIYVRTLAALEPGEDIWLELEAPRQGRRVRLAGRVAWRRPFGRSANALVPAGFGVRVTDGLKDDMHRWHRGCEVLADAAIGVPSVPFLDVRRASKVPSQLAPALIETQAAMSA